MVTASKPSLVKTPGECALGDLRNDGRLPQRELLLHGRKTGLWLYALEYRGAIRCEHGYLVFGTEDCPYEEALHIYLVTRDGRYLDNVSISNIYTTGVFENLVLSYDQTIRFTFIVPWELTLFPKKRWRFPGLTEPFGIWRSPGFSRWMGFRRLDAAVDAAP